MHDASITTSASLLYKEESTILELIQSILRKFEDTNTIS